MQVRGVHSPRPYLSRYVPTSPFRTTSPVCSATSVLGFAQVTSLGFSPSGFAVSARGSRVPAAASPPAVVASHPAVVGWGRSDRLQGFARSKSPVPPVVGFPSHRGAAPLVGFFEAPICSGEQPVGPRQHDSIAKDHLRCAPIAPVRVGRPTPLEPCAALYGVCAAPACPRRGHTMHPAPPRRFRRPLRRSRCPASRRARCLRRSVPTLPFLTTSSA